MSVHLLGLVPLHVETAGGDRVFLIPRTDLSVMMFLSQLGNVEWACVWSLENEPQGHSSFLVTSQPQETLDFILLEEWCSDKYWFLFQNTVMILFPKFLRAHANPLRLFLKLRLLFSPLLVRSTSIKIVKRWTDHLLWSTGATRKIFPEQIMSLSFTLSSGFYQISSDISTQFRKRL